MHGFRTGAMCCVTLAFAGVACDRKSGERDRPSPSTAATPQATKSVSTAPAAVPTRKDGAGVIQHARGKINYPAGSGIRAFAPVAKPVEPANRSLVRVSDVFAIDSDRALFAKPVTVTLSLDKSKLPANVKGEDLMPVLGEEMCIAQAVEITRGAVAGDHRGGSLQLTVECSNYVNANDLIVIAFPLGDDGKARQHSVGNLKRAAIINDWETYPKALAWIVNVSRARRFDIRLNATMKMGSDVRITWADKKPDREGNRIIVSSGALAGLDKTDQRNGLRFVLYRDTKPDGEFQPVTSNFLDQNVSVDFFKSDANLKGYLVAPDKLALFDPNVYRSGQKPQSGPFYYRVSQQLLIREGGACAWRAMRASPTC